MSGEIPEQEFLERIHYHEEWGCEWAGYKAIFETARQLRIPVYGVDCHPRNDMRRIGRRDLCVARRIVRLMKKNPSKHSSSFLANLISHRIICRRECECFAGEGNRCRGNLLIFQNIDALYWKLQEGGEVETRAVRVREACYCVFNCDADRKIRILPTIPAQMHRRRPSGDWTCWRKLCWKS